MGGIFSQRKTGLDFPAALRMFFHHGNRGVMRPVFLFILSLIAAGLPAQTLWEYEGGPCGGRFIAVIDHNGGLAAAPYYRSFVLFGNAAGTSWRQADLPDAADQPFSLCSMGTRLLAGGFGRVYRSDDNGATWAVTEIPALQSAQIVRLACSGDTVYACTSGHLARSADRGASWLLLRTGDIRDVAARGDGRVALAEAGGVAESGDGGASWFVRPSSPADARRLFSFEGAVFAAREVSAQRPGAAVLFRLGTGDEASWDTTTLVEPFVTSMTAHDGALYAGSGAAPGPQLLRSSDGGASWEAINETRLPFHRRSSVSVLHGAAGGLLAGIANIGIWRLEDNAESWRFVTDGFFPVGVARVGFSGEHLVAYSMKEDFVAMRGARGETWEQLPYAEDARPGDMLVHQAAIVLGTSRGTRSTIDLGASWDSASIGDGTRRVLALGASGGRILAGCAGGVHAWSSDPGRQWHAGISQDISTWYSFAESVPGRVFAATAPDGLHASSDTGATWVRRDIPSVPGAVFDVAVSEGTVYTASTRGIVALDDASGAALVVYAGPAYRLCATPRGLAAATQNDGIIFFPGYGSQWGTINQGLPDAHFASPDVCRIALAYEAGRLYFGNCGLPGLWSMDLSTAVSVGVAAAARTVGIDAVYPQPLRGDGWVSLHVPDGAAVRLTLRDLFGRELRLLFDGVMTQPERLLPLRTEGLAAGVYLIELHAGRGRAAAMLHVSR